jgi:hypothetical protein
LLVLMPPPDEKTAIKEEVSSNPRTWLSGPSLSRAYSGVVTLPEQEYP